MNKFNSRKVEHNGMKFDSRKEYMRWQELCLLQKAGAIQHLQRQVKFLLIPTQTEIVERYSAKTGKRLKDKVVTLENECSYVADFVYCKDGKQVVEDVKGYTKGAAYSVFVIKRKLMLQEYGIRVKEI